MVGMEAFDEHPEAYDSWFAENQALYEAELQAVRSFLPGAGRGVEIGVGTGRFAAPLGIRLGVEPSSGMARLAKRRGIQVVKAVAEALPFASRTFDYAVMVTVDCFLQDLSRALGEAGRVLVPEGIFVIGMIDRESEPGRNCDRRKGQGRFCRGADLHSVDEMETWLAEAGFAGVARRQTLLSGQSDPCQVIDGYGSGGFVVIRVVNSVKA